MVGPGIAHFFRDTRSEWVRLRTLILLRWMAIGGQLAAITVADWVYGVSLPLGLCYMAVGASIIANLVSIFVYPQNKRLSELEAMLTLLFDLSQLAFLLYLTGGLTNPFALLILAPVTISASALELRTTLLLGALAMLFITAIALVNVPLRFDSGTVLEIPAFFEFGFWLAIVIGIAFIGLYSRRVALEIRSMSDALLATQMALAREQKLTDLGGVVAAAAHELGTPLATIKLVSAEMIEELADRPDLLDDARLIRDQADRCRDILRSMGRAGKDDLHLRQAPVDSVLRESAEPHMNRGKTLVFNCSAGAGGSDRQPLMLRRPEVIHGLRNLVQNAVDFCRNTVWIDGEWTADRLIVRIVDDGEGYPPNLLGRIGDPFVRSALVRSPSGPSQSGPSQSGPSQSGRDSSDRSGQADQDQVHRPEYEGMGLGLFIAKTLLERTGAELSFANAANPFLTPAERPERCGAIVVVVWKLTEITATTERGQGLGKNKPITV